MKYFLTALAWSCTLTASAQDAIFSQFYSAPLYTNPALAGASKCGRLSASYRNQWAAIPGAFTDISASYDQHVDGLSGAIGALLTSSREGNGAYSTINAGLIYSYNFQVNDVFSIKPAIQASFVNRRFDWTALTFHDQFDASSGLIGPSQETFPGDEAPASKSYADFSAGLVGYSENFYAGFAVHHLGRPVEGFVGAGEYRLAMKYTAHAGAVIDIRPKQYRFRDPKAPTLSPNIIYQQQGATQQINYGMYANVYPLVFGVWYRQTIAFDEPESLTFLLGIHYNSLNIGYSYDLTISKLTNASGGSHELSIGYLLPCREVKPKIKMINCPSF
ncbi:MAG: type IX secretion system membrane protein PorP/SprF [Bacteroidales bacterium]|nr:type IX secretion system membrane protein PorP/SprF [Bacteroidales bacterium]